MSNPADPSNKSEIPFGRPWIDDDDRQAVMDVLRGTVLTHGPKCKEFEEKFSEFVGGGSAVSVSSCMAALHLSSLHFGFGPGDEVIVPAETHVATVHAVELVGAKPVFVDCDVKTGNMNPDLISKKITKNTKALFVVHFVGIPADMKRICQIAANHNLKVIEDCALALGSTIDGKHVGLWGDLGCFSFYPAKHMTTAEGGMLISKNQKDTREIAHFRAFSVDRTFNERKIPGIYDVTGVGLNYRMSELHAALGCTQLKKMKRSLEIRNRNFAQLKEMVTRVEGVSHVLDTDDASRTNSHYSLNVVLNEEVQKFRNDIVLKLTEQKIGCSVYYPQPVPRMKHYREKYKVDPSDYKNAAIVSDGSIALPVGPHVGPEQIELISQVFAGILKEIQK